MPPRQPDLVIDGGAFTWTITRLRPSLPKPEVKFTPADPAIGFHPVLGPAQCPRGHYPGPGKILRKWTPCMCPPALEARAAGWGHDTEYCLECEDEGYETVCWWPPHDPTGRTKG